MLRIHHLTDTHYPRSGNRFETYLHLLQTGKLGPKPDLILHTGDLVDGVTTEIQPSEATPLLRKQHEGLRKRLNPLGIPFHAVCHSHDRMGDPANEYGRTFLEVWQQPLLRVLPLPHNLDVIFLSGSVTLPPLAAAHPAPAWGFDFFDEHVLDALRTLVTAHCRAGAYRLLCTHLPTLLPPGYFDSTARYPQPPIGAEGVGRILPALAELDIRWVLSGHLHKPARHTLGRTTFIVGSNTLEPYSGFGEILFDGSEPAYLFHTIPAED